VMGVVALGFVALANITSVSVSLFASGLALRHVPWLRRSKWHSILLLTLVPCALFAIWPQQLYAMGDAFLAYNGTLFAPISGIIFVDYFLLRRQRLCLRSIFDAAPHGAYHYWRGVNLLAVGGVVLGQVVYFSLYNPVTQEAHWLFRFVPASIGAFFAPAIFYWAGMRLRGVRLSSSEYGDRDTPPKLTTPTL
jgi:nucleobase:cation symporter-1, NCS1 family